jgi:hypothetical protein
MDKYDYDGEAPISINWDWKLSTHIRFTTTNVIENGSLRSLRYSIFTANDWFIPTVVELMKEFCILESGYQNFTNSKYRKIPKDFNISFIRSYSVDLVSKPSLSLYITKEDFHKYGLNTLINFESETTQFALMNLILEVLRKEIERYKLLNKQILEI